jgi:excisionase family DNA binding protein
MTELQLAAKAVQMALEAHPRPLHVTQKQAAEMLGLSVPTVRKMVASGALKLNKCARIHIHQIDRYLDSIKGDCVRQEIDNNLLNYDEIIKEAEGNKILCGIYFLINENDVVYIGQSVNIHSRIAQHKNSKTFDKFSYIECEKSELSHLEVKYIKKFKPKYNLNCVN